MRLRPAACPCHGLRRSVRQLPRRPLLTVEQIGDGLLFKALPD